MRFKKQYLIWGAAVLLLLLLYIMSSTDLIISEKEQEVYQISVIISDVDDSAYSNFRKGMEQAAYELHADVNFITLYDRDHNVQQRNLFEREVNDGAQGIIIAPISKTEAEELYGGKNTVPVIYINDKVNISNRFFGANYSFDLEEAGTKLFQKLQDECSSDTRFIFLSTGALYGKRDLFYKGFENSCTKGSVEFQIINAETYVNISQEALSERIPDTILVTLDSEAAEIAADFRRRCNDEQISLQGLYGLDNSSETLAKLRSGIFDGITATDDFALGYSSIKDMIYRIDHSNEKMEDKNFQYFYIEKDDLTDQRYEKILYPME